MNYLEKKLLKTINGYVKFIESDIEEAEKMNKEGIEGLRKREKIEDINEKMEVLKIACESLDIIDRIRKNQLITYTCEKE